jgi:hypothetical protein
MFIRVAIIGFAILMFILAALQLILSRGEEEAKKKVKGRFISGVFALLFVGIIETWIRVVYKGSISQGQHLFSQLINLAIFFAGPLVIFFLILAGYYYITSAGDDAKIKKAKAILVNTVIAVLILFACYSFLIDLSKFSLT